MSQLLVGRDDELAVLGAITADLPSRQGTAVHIVGEAGIGKSALVQFVRHDLRRRGVAVRHAVADETDRRRPLSVATTLFPDVGLGAVRDPVGTALADLERLARDEAVAVIADDLHWADDTSLDVIRALSQRAGELGVLVLTAARPHPMPDGVRHLQMTARRDGTLLEPSSLPAEQVAALAVAMLGAEPGERLRQLLDDAAGNPFLVCELLDALAGTDGLIDRGGTVDTRAGVRLPSALARTLVERIQLVAPGTELLMLAAVVTPSGFVPEELAAISGASMPDVLHGVAALVDAGVLVDRPPGLALRHELLRTAVREVSSEAIMQALRRRAATVLEGQGATPERLATCLLANIDPDESGSVELLARTARRVAPSNPLAAADLLGTALDHISTNDERNLAWTVDLSWTLIAAGRSAAVPDLVERRCGSSERFSVGLERALGHALAISGRIDAVRRRFYSTAAGDLDAVGSRDDPEFVDAVGELAQLRVVSGDLQAAERLIEWVEASPTAVSTARTASIGTARSYLCGVAARFAESVEWGDRARQAVLEDAEGGVTAVSATLSMALSLDLGGDAAAALELLRRPEQPGPHVTWAAPLLQFATALVLYRQGSWDDSLAEADAGLRAAAEVDLGLGVHWPYATSALIHIARGELAAADEWLERSRQVTSERALGTEWLVYATVMAADARGETSSAASLMELLVGGVRAAGAPALLLLCGPAAVRLGLATERDALADAVVAELGGLVTRTPSPVVAGVGAWAGGLRRGDARAIDAAASVLGRAGRRADAARACHDGAVVALEHGDIVLARALAGRAFHKMESLDASQMHLRLRQELRDRGLAMRPRRTPRRATHGWEAVTPTETSVVDLVAQGMTNTEIAERLFVSRRTVESHLARIYTKLDLANRGQLAAASRLRAG